MLLLGLSVFCNRRGLGMTSLTVDGLLAVSGSTNPKFKAWLKHQRTSG
jgi:hypothetical protein